MSRDDFYNGGLWGKIFVFCQIKLEITSNKKVIPKKPLTNLYEMNSNLFTNWMVWALLFFNNYLCSDAKYGLTIALSKTFLANGQMVEKLQSADFEFINRKYCRTL